MTTCSLRLATVHPDHPIKRSGYQRFNPARCKAAYSPRLRWNALTRFLNDGRVCLSNNAAERSLR
ncbi:MAG: IS66 family transposase, partial [Novosphingobium sp.]|uniref:IS66 family transposase n=1 Tax=Novosphingobium sp. TaxID=1874826 RepID=UPI001DC35A0F|nr:IS66 family transposase [Novosphingobium sp.]MBY0391911.1 IS66 family transposase [Novosphingobium sp.]